VAKSVQLSDEAYATLKALKQPNESFSDVVKRLASGRKDPRLLKKLPALRKGHDFDRVRAAMRAADAAKFESMFGERKP
jgi:predicted CopG family antitoxin